MKTKFCLNCQTQSRRQHLLINILAGMMLAVLSSASAATDMWTGSNNGNWNNGANWLSGTAPSVFDSLVFANQTGSAETATNDFAAGTAFDGITFGSSSAGSTFTLIGNSILLSGASNNIAIGITNTTSLAETVSNNLTLDWGYYTFSSPAGSLNLNGALTDTNLGGVADFGSSNVKSASYVLDGTGLIAGLGGAGMIGNSGSLGGFANLATISGGTVSAYTYSGTTIIAAAGNIGATTQANATNIELTATAAGNYTLANGTGNTFINTVLMTESGGSAKLVVGSANSGTLVMGTTNAGTSMYVGGFYVPLSTTAQEITVGGGSSCSLTAGPISGNPVPGEIIFAINGNNTSNEGENNAVIKDNGSGGKVTVVKTGTGSMFFNGITSTYSGGTYVDQGYAQMNGVSDFGTGPVYISSGATVLLPNTGTTVANNFFVSPGAGASYSTAELLDRDGDTLSGTIALMGNPVSAMPGDRVAVNATGKTLTFTGQITGGGTLDLRSVNTTTTFAINNGTGNANNWTGGIIVDVAAAADSITVQNKTPGTFTGNLLLVGSGGAGTITYDMWDLNESIYGLNSSGTGTMNIQTGNGATLTVGNNNANGTFSGAIINKVALTKTGNGTQTISGANTYSGATVANQGELITTTASTGAGSYTVTNGTTLDVQVTGAGKQLTNSSLTLGNSGSDTSTLQVDTLSTGNPSVAPIKVVGALTASGTVNIQLSGSALVAGTFPLISYGSENVNLNGATLITSPRVNATLSDNGSGLISVTINYVDYPEWLGGASGNWDINNAANTIWQGIQTLTPTYYKESGNPSVNDAVTFDDNVIGTTTVNLTTTLTPAAVTVNNTFSNYTFSGTGNITGTALLTKKGTGTLIVDNSGANNFSGGVVITAGTVQIGNNDANGSLPSGTVTDNGSLVFNRSDTALTVGNIITGTGALTNNGSGTVTLSASPSTFSGSTTINGGILQISSSSGGNGCLQNSAIIVNSGGELDLNASDALGFSVSQPITISGIVKKINSQSETLFRPIILSGGTMTTTVANVEQFESFGNFITTSNSTANFINGSGRFGLRTASCYISNQPNSTLTFNCVIDQNSAGAPLNKFGPGTVILSNTNIFTGGVNLNGGFVKVNATETPGTSGPLGASGTISFTNGTLQYSSADSADYSARFATSANQAYSIDTAGQSVIFATALTSSGGTLTLTNSTGSGTLTLSAVNTYSGNTTIKGGTLALSGSGSINNSPQIILAGGTLNLSGLTKTFSLANNQTLALTGSSTVNGSFTNASGSAINLGNNTLTQTGSLTLNGGTNAFTLSTTTNGNNGQIAITGNLTLNGISTIQVTYTTVQAGRYKLIAYTGAESGSAAANLHLSDAFAGGRQTVNLDDSVAGEIDLVVGTGQPAQVAWTGADPNYPSQWNNTQTAANWFSTDPNASGDPTHYYDADFVTFSNNNNSQYTVGITNIVSPGLILVSNDAGNYTFVGSGSISGLTSLVKQDTGILTLTESGGDNFSGGITVGGGSLILSNTSVNISGGLTITNGAITVAHSGTINGGLTMNNAAGGSPSALVVGSGTLNGGITSVGSLTVSNSPVIAGGLTVNGGTVLLDQTTTPSGATTVASNATVNVGNNDASGFLPSGTMTDNGSLIFNRADNFTNSSVISGAGTVANNGSGTNILSVANTFSGGLVINNGTLQVASTGGGSTPLGGAVNDTSLTAASNVTVNAGATLVGLGSDAFGYNSANAAPAIIFIHGGTVTDIGTSNYRITLPNLTFTGGTLTSAAGNAGNAGNYSLYGTGPTLTGKPAIVTTLSNNTTAVISGGPIALQQDNQAIGTTIFNVAAGNVIGGPTPGVDLLVSSVLTNFTTEVGGVTKIGAGVMVLSGTNTYTGGTSVSNGTLLVNGSLASASAVTVTNATLGGIGTIGGATTMQPNSILAAGNGGIGMLHFSGALTLNAFSTNNFAVTISGGASNKVVVVGALTNNNSVISITSGAALRPGIYTLFTYGSDNGSFNATPMFDVAPVHAATIVDDNAGHINLVVPNTAPVAGSSFTMDVVLGTPSVVQIVGGKNAPVDADGDVLAITGVSGNVNGTVTWTGTNITYTATNAAAVSDSFSYTVGDGYGGSASQTVNVVIDNSAGGQIPSNATLLPGTDGLGDAVLSYAGIPGYKYALDETHDLGVPITWTPVVTNMAATNGVVGSLTFTNPMSGAPTNDYYRTRSVP